MSKWINCLLIIISCLILVSSAKVSHSSRRKSVNGVRARRLSSLFDAQVERQNLVQKYFKKLNTPEGKLKLVGGSAENEGARLLFSL